MREFLGYSHLSANCAEGGSEKKIDRERERERKKNKKKLKERRRKRRGDREAGRDEGGRGGGIERKKGARLRTSDPKQNVYPKKFVPALCRLHRQTGGTGTFPNQKKRKFNADNQRTPFHGRIHDHIYWHKRIWSRYRRSPRGGGRALTAEIL